MQSDVSRSDLKVSVIIPVYNSESTLNECVQSIIKQDNGLLEIILVDDGSETPCYNLCEELSNEYPSIIRLFHQENAGSLIARINGVKNSTGEYLMFVDADDVLLDDAIFHICEDIEDGQDLYIYDYFMDSIGGEEQTLISIMDETKRTLFYEDKKQIALAFMKGKMNTVCATAIKRSLFEKCRFYLPKEKIENGEDRLLKLQLIVFANKIIYNPYAFYHYKWYPETQGSKLRNGYFDAKIYRDFRNVWFFERKSYHLLGFSKDESNKYDKDKITRICSLFEKSFVNRNINKTDVASLVMLLYEDDLFIDLAQNEVLKFCRKHIRITTFFIRKGKPTLLIYYWKICNIIRKIVYK